MTVGDTAYRRILDALHFRDCIVKDHGHRAQATCPAHPDRSPSLSITGIEGSALLYCHAGCDTDDILNELGLARRDLYDTPRGATYTYTDLQGATTRQVHRTPDKKFRQSGDTKSQAQLYRLTQVTAAVSAGQTIYLVEGEKDVHALETLGAVATTSPMGASNWSKVDPTPLAGATVAIVPDRDHAGVTYARDATRTLEAIGATVTILLPATGNDAADHVAAGNGLDELIPGELPDLPEPTDEEGLVPDDGPGGAVERLLPLLDWHELFATEDDGEEWVLEPLVAARRIVALYSKPKVGKSLLMLELAVAISRGKQALGTTPPRPYRILYVDFENDPRGDLRSRLEAMEVGPADLDNLCYLSFPSLAKLDTAEGALQLLAAVEHYHCEGVVIDTVSRAVGGEENSNDTWLDFYRHTGLALKQAGTWCIRLDHSGKDKEKGMRGGSAKYGDVDAVWRLDPLGIDDVILKCTDHRMPVPTEQIALTRTAFPLRHEVKGDTWQSVMDSRARWIDQRLDQLGVPSSASVREAGKALREAGEKVAQGPLSVAVKVRKQRLDVPPDGSSQAPESTPEQRYGNTSVTPVTTEGSVTGTPHPVGGRPEHPPRDDVTTTEHPPGRTDRLGACNRCYCPVDESVLDQHDGRCQTCAEKE